MEGFGRLKSISSPLKLDWTTFLEKARTEGRHRPISAAAQLHQITRAIARCGYEQQRHAACVRQVVLPRMRRHLHIINPASQNIWQEALAAGFVRRQPKFGMLVKITGLDLHWHVKLAKAVRWTWQGAERHVEQVIRHLHRRFRGWNYILTVEFALHHVKQEMLICFHAEGLVWGENLDLGAVKNKFPGGLYDSYGLDEKKVTNLSGVLRYMTKIDLRVHTYRNKLFRKSHHSARKITNKELLDASYALRSLRWPDVTAAGGEGRKIVRAALDHVGWE